jgi:hypothetical protein
MGEALANLLENPVRAKGVPGGELFQLRRQPPF